MSDYMTPMPADDLVLATARAQTERGQGWTVHMARAVLARLDEAEGRRRKRAGRGPGRIGREVLARLREAGRTMMLDEVHQLQPDCDRVRLQRVLERLEKRGAVQCMDPMYGGHWRAVADPGGMS